MAEQLISTSVHETLPESYVRDAAERPRLDEVIPDARIPVVDLAHPDRAAVVSQIGGACRSHGFFQVLNHGLPVELMLAAMAVAHEFFRLSPEEKAKLYSDDPAKKIRLSTSFNVRKETVHNWRDYLRLHCHPLEQFVPDWPSNPSAFSMRRSVRAKCTYASFDIPAMKEAKANQLARDREDSNGTMGDALTRKTVKSQGQDFGQQQQQLPSSTDLSEHFTC